MAAVEREWEAKEVTGLRDCTRIETGNVNLQSVQLAQAGCLVSDAENIGPKQPAPLHDRAPSQHHFTISTPVCM
jgi:hypothetical protein